MLPGVEVGTDFPAHVLVVGEPDDELRLRVHPGVERPGERGVDPGVEQFLAAGAGDRDERIRGGGGPEVHLLDPAGHVGELRWWEVAPDTSIWAARLRMGRVGVLVMAYEIRAGQDVVGRSATLFGGGQRISQGAIGDRFARKRELVEGEQDPVAHAGAPCGAVAGSAMLAHCGASAVNNAEPEWRIFGPAHGSSLFRASL